MRENTRRVWKVDLQQAHRGQIDFQTLVARNSSKFERASAYYHGWVSRVAACPIDQEDLKQIALTACWQALTSYRYMCPACPKATPNSEIFLRHTIRWHGQALNPRTTLQQYVEGEIGRALDHEVRRYRRRSKWNTDRSVDLFEGLQEPHQEIQVTFRRLVEQAKERLDERKWEVFQGMALGHSQSEVPGLTDRQVQRLRARIRVELRGVA